MCTTCFTTHAIDFLYSKMIIDIYAFRVNFLISHTVYNLFSGCHRCCQKGHKSTDCYKFMHHAELAAAMRKEAQEETMAALKN